jgi:hypothetical protein
VSDGAGAGVEEAGGSPGPDVSGERVPERPDERGRSTPKTAASDHRLRDLAAAPATVENRCHVLAALEPVAVEHRRLVDHAVDGRTCAAISTRGTCRSVRIRGHAK